MCSDPSVLISLKITECSFETKYFTPNSNNHNVTSPQHHAIDAQFVIHVPEPGVLARGHDVVLEAGRSYPLHEHVGGAHVRIVLQDGADLLPKHVTCNHSITYISQRALRWHHFCSRFDQTQFQLCCVRATIVLWETNLRHSGGIQANRVKKIASIRCVFWCFI